MRFSRLCRRALSALSALSVTAAVVAACGGGGGTSSSGMKSSISGIKQTGPGLTEPTRGSGSRVRGGTVTFAEAPASPPDYIFPMYSVEYCSPNNLGELENLMYRPLYWFGNNYSPTVDYNYSIGQKPIYSNGGKTVTIHLNHYKWSDGETVTARDLVFWMNVLDADPAREYCGYVAGKFPSIFTSYRAVNATTFQLTLNRSTTRPGCCTTSSLS